jgi:hypothetical protein
VLNRVAPRSPAAADSDSDLGALETLSAEAWQLEPPAPCERASVLRSEAGLLVDRLLVRVARGRGALDVAIGEALAALSDGDRTLRLGFSGIGDYARDRLGLSARTAQAMARLARELRNRPLLRNAVRLGEVSARKAQTILPVARGDAEAAWVARARTDTVRALEVAVRELAPSSEADEDWERMVLHLSPADRATLDEALALAGKLLGATAPRFRRLEAICQEYLGAHRDPDPESADGTSFTGPLTHRLEQMKAALEEEHARWAWLAALSPIDPVSAPASDVDGGDAARLDAELRRLGAMRDRWDELVGHLALLVSCLGLWRDMGFASLGHYCSERLGLAGRTVEQRIWLGRRLHSLPPLRAAMRDGRITYEQARLVAGVADHDSVESWIARAEGTTCIALRRELEAGDEAQMCAAGALELRVPARVAPVIQAALRAARAASGGWISPGECLARVARHFIEAWREALAERRTIPHEVLERDRGLCQVPGCSRAADHAHHVRFRSRGGGDDPSNLVSLCAAHHLHGVHRGFLSVRGVAPAGLRWEVAAMVH